MTMARMAKAQTKHETGRAQIRFDLTVRSNELVTLVRAKLFDRIDRSEAVNMMVEKLGALDIDMLEAILFKDGKDREQAMMQALRRKLASHADDISAEAELGRAEAAIARAQKAIAKNRSK